MNRIEIGIPVYQALNLLPNALDSLLYQTNKNFDVCIVIDGDGLDYTKIINRYKQSGLNIRTIILEKNMGVGYARQIILDTTKAEYISYLDSDDMFLPHAIDFFLNNIDFEYECIKGLALYNSKRNVPMIQSEQMVTFLHGVAYQVNFLKQQNISFPLITTEEDAYFNLLVFQLAKNIGFSKEPIYFKQFNPNSIVNKENYMIKYSHNFFIAVFSALNKLNGKIKKEEMCKLIIGQLITLYCFYQKCIFFNADMKYIDAIIKNFKQNWINEYLYDPSIYNEIPFNINQYEFENDIFIPFTETYFSWLARVILND